MSVINLSLLVGIQQKVSELVLSVTSCPSIIILENTVKLVYGKNVIMVTMGLCEFFFHLTISGSVFDLVPGLSYNYCFL
jgi:hypothetical protein